MGVVARIAPDPFQGESSVGFSHFRVLDLVALRAEKARLLDKLRLVGGCVGIVAALALPPLKGWVDETLFRELLHRVVA